MLFICLHHVIFCCVLCVQKQRHGGNTQWSLCLWMERLCRRVICSWTVALWGAQGCAEHPWVHHCQAVPFVLRCVSRISATDGSIKTIFPNLTRGFATLGCFPKVWEIQNSASPASGVWWWWGGSHGESPMDLGSWWCFPSSKLEMLPHDKRKKPCNSVKVVR